MFSVARRLIAKQLPRERNGEQIKDRSSTTPALGSEGLPGAGLWSCSAAQCGCEPAYISTTLLTQVHVTSGFSSSVALAA